MEEIEECLLLRTWTSTKSTVARAASTRQHVEISGKQLKNGNTSMLNTGEMSSNDAQTALKRPSNDAPVVPFMYIYGRKSYNVAPVNVAFLRPVLRFLGTFSSQAAL